MTTKQTGYGEAQIQVLKGLEPVRKRPGMYIGSTDIRGLHHLLWEVTDNAIDEALAGECTEIIVELDENNVLSVTDNGRGIPTGIHPTEGISTVEVVFTILHAGGKFGGEDSGYKVAGGLHGVGASVTNALSRWLEVEVRRDGYVWQARFERGETIQPLKQIRKMGKDDKRGTTVRWLYDDAIFEPEAHYSHQMIEQRLRDKSFLITGLTFVLRMPGREEQRFYSRNGLAEYVAQLNDERTTVNKKVIYLSTEEQKEFADENLDVPVDVALQWIEDDDERIYSFANVISTVDGGTHVTGLRTAVSNAINRYAEEQGKIKSDKERFEGRDIFDGLVAAVAVKVSDAQFESQTKNKLNNTEARSAVQSFTYAALSNWLNDSKNAKEAKAILERCVIARDIRIARSKVSKKVKNQATSIFADNPLAGKILECAQSTPVEQREIYIVEGDSAAGSAEFARDPAFQAVLPLKGKPLNVLGAPSGKAFDNKEIEAILIALGGRKDIVGRRIVATLEPQMRRYGRVCFCSDADLDGAHIRALLLTMFHELFPALIREGRVFIAQAPLFKIALDADGTKFVYAYTEEERDELVKKHNRAGKDAVSRFKGLGEMNADDLGATCFHPETRRLLQVTVSDAGGAQETLSLLMGKEAGKAAERRREWLEDVGLEVEAV